MQSINYKFTFSVNFPYLVLLISGGHCLLAVVQNVNKFLLLGQSIDNAPGDVIDKVNKSVMKISICLTFILVDSSAFEDKWNSRM